MPKSVLITIPDGEIKGKILQNYNGDNFYGFLGIPYAEAPIGDLRFTAPRPIKPWTGVKDATKEGPPCPSRHTFFAYFIGQEDNCLNLNVFTQQLPKKKKTSLKSVMVWIHGGAFLYGCNKSELFGPEYLMTEDIVLVFINYRLGVLGFLSLEDPSLEVPGNAGLKDMVMALKWVQKNISYFNGDPDNVTIFGESAGSAAVHYLYISPLAKGLFHKAIMQSGSALNPWARGCSNGKIIANLLGYKETEEVKILEYLKKISSKKLVNAECKSLDIFTAEMVRPFGPVVEKGNNKEAFLVQEPIEILKGGTFNDVPLIIGYNSKEGIFFDAIRKVSPAAKITKDFETEIDHQYKIEKGSKKSKKIANDIKEYYYGNERPSKNNIDKLYLLKSDTQFVCGIQRSLELQKQSAHQPIYMYRMSVDTSINYFKKMATTKMVIVLFIFYFASYKCAVGKCLFLKLAKCVPTNFCTGVCHADDVGYLFTSFVSSRLPKDSLEEISMRRFVKLWTNFARTGNPTPDPEDALLNNVLWKPVTHDKNYYLDLGSELKLDSNPDMDRIKFWNKIYSNF